MEEPGSPAAVKANEQTESVLFTYFQGDINSVVDEHFSRALNRANKPKDLSNKGKSSAQPPKSEAAPLQWSLPASPWSEAAFPSPPSGRIQFAPSEDPHSSLRALASPSAQPSDPWSFPPRPSTSFGLPQMAYAQPMLTEDPGPVERQYSNSFLNLLHGDRQAGRAPLGPSSKPDLGPGWTAPAGFREPLGSGIVLDSGRQVAEKKKDLYWY